MYTCQWLYVPCYCLKPQLSFSVDWLDWYLYQCQGWTTRLGNQPWQWKISHGNGRFSPLKPLYRFRGFRGLFSAMLDGWHSFSFHVSRFLRIHLIRQVSLVVGAKRPGLSQCVEGRALSADLCRCLQSNWDIGMRYHAMYLTNSII